jgi:hypothetical protein
MIVRSFVTRLALSGLWVVLVAGTFLAIDLYT